MILTKLKQVGRDISGRASNRHLALEQGYFSELLIGEIVVYGWKSNAC